MSENKSHVDIGVDTYQDELDLRVKHLEVELNKNIGRYWWKSYINTAFWNNISTPISLIITIITALTTAQTATNNLLSEAVMKDISLAALLISTLNTFFRPSTQLARSMENMNNWRALGSEFEKIYINTTITTEQGLSDREAKFKELMERVLEMKRSQDTNFITDLIHLASKALCIKDKESWKPDI
jgi:hypothetical protein